MIKYAKDVIAVIFCFIALYIQKDMFINKCLILNGFCFSTFAVV